LRSRPHCGSACIARVAFGAQLQRVRLVAIHAADPVLVHFALPEGTPDLDLLALLAIGVAIGRRQHGQAVAVLERGTGPALLAQRRAAGVTGDAAIHAGGVGRFFGVDRSRRQ